MDEPALAQVYGDMLPESRHIRFTVEREALIVRVPEVMPGDPSATGTMEPIK